MGPTGGNFHYSRINEQLSPDELDRQYCENVTATNGLHRAMISSFDGRKYFDLKTYRPLTYVNPNPDPVIQFGKIMLTAYFKTSLYDRWGDVNRIANEHINEFTHAVQPIASDFAVTNDIIIAMFRGIIEFDIPKFWERYERAIQVDPGEPVDYMSDIQREYYPDDRVNGGNFFSLQRHYERVTAEQISRQDYTRMKSTKNYLENASPKHAFYGYRWMNITDHPMIRGFCIFVNLYSDRDINPTEGLRIAERLDSIFNPNTIRDQLINYIAKRYRDGINLDPIIDSLRPDGGNSDDDIDDIDDDDDDDDDIEVVC